MLNRISWLFLCFFVVLGLRCGRSEGLPVGTPAPEIQAATWFNAPNAPSLASLRGEVVLLEFWATW